MLNKLAAAVAIVLCIVIFVYVLVIWSRPVAQEAPVTGVSVTEVEEDPYYNVDPEQLVRGDAEAYK